VKELLGTLEYGPAPEAPSVVEAWLEDHGRSFGHFIGNKWVKPEGRKTYDTFNPATGQRLATTVQGMGEGGGRGWEEGGDGRGEGMGGRKGVGGGRGRREKEIKGEGGGQEGESDIEGGGIEGGGGQEEERKGGEGRG
jgi:hypothetical protein